MKPNDPIRAYIIRVPCDAVLEAFNTHRYLDQGRGVIVVHSFEDCSDEQGNKVTIPLDAVVSAANHDWASRTFGFVVEHPSFPAVQVGSEPTRLTLVSRLVQVREFVGGEDGPLVVEGGK